MIAAAVFDVGEVLVNETREYGMWADWMGVPRHTSSSVFGGVIASGRDYRANISRSSSPVSTYRPSARPVRPQGSRRRSASTTCTLTLSRLAALRATGLRVGVAGNQTARAGTILDGLGLPADWIATSDSWGVERPSPASSPAPSRSPAFPPARCCI